MNSFGGPKVAFGQPPTASGHNMCFSRLNGSCNGLALTLLVLGVFADDHDAALALDDLALFADGLDRRTNLHLSSSFGTRFCYGGL